MGLTLLAGSCMIRSMEIDEDSLYRQIGERLRARREQLDMRQSALADAIGVRRTSVSNIESGRQKAPLHLIYRICAVLGIDIATILPTAEELARPDLVPVSIDGVIRRLPVKTAESIERLRDAPLDGGGE